MTDNETQDFAEILTRRVEELAATARATSAAIENDQATVRDGSEPIDDLIVDSVIKRVDSMAADCDELNRILTGYHSLVDQHRASLERGKGSQRADQRAQESELSGTEPESKPQGPAISEGVRLLATQMSVAGSGPAEIAKRLRDEFGVENSAALVRELFGQS